MAVRRNRPGVGDHPAEKISRDLAPSPMPDEPAPMLCTLIDHPFDGPEWTFEPRLDGLRILARFDGRQVT